MGDLRNEHSAAIRDFCNRAPVVPVLVIDDVNAARPLAEALIEGGLPALEVTLRTPAALECIRIMADVPGGVVGAGTVLSAEHVQAVKQAGARFAVSPGATDALLDAALKNDLPLLPGAATASEAMRLFSQGIDIQKFFPAEAAGGAALLKSLASPLPDISFCPTGGVSLKNARDYLELPNVLCVGGSWVAPAELVNRGDWSGIEALARDAVAALG